MSQWTEVWKYFQVVYLVSVVALLLVYSVILFEEKLSLRPDDIYQHAVLDHLELFGEENPPPTKQELAWLSIIFRIVIASVAPASLVIYRSRLLTLEAF